MKKDSNFYFQTFYFKVPEFWCGRTKNFSEKELHSFWYGHGKNLVKKNYTLGYEKNSKKVSKIFKKINFFSNCLNFGLVVVKFL